MTKRKFIYQWIMTAKIYSTCKETKASISPGDKILFIPRGRDAAAQSFCDKSKAFAQANTLDEAHFTGFKDN